jgi:hypothetical protein
MKSYQDKYWEHVTKGHKKMLNAKVRAGLYAFIAIASPVVAYLGTEGKLDTFWVGLFSVVVTAVSALAFSKVTPDEE